MLKEKNRFYKVIIICSVLIVVSILIFMSFREKNSASLLIVGDSIGEGAGCSDPALKWYKKLVPYMKDNYGINLEITNVSMGGNTSYAGYVRTMNLDEKDTYDYVIICYGQNDAVEEFSLYYENLLRILRKKYPSAVMISVLESSQREYTEKIQCIQELCEYYGVYVADTIAAFNNSGMEYDTLCDDGTHPNDKGYELYFSTVAKVMKQYHEGSSLESVRLEEIEPVNESVKEFETYRYYPAKELKKVGDLKYELEIGKLSGKLGIDYTTFKGEHWIKLVASDDVVHEKKIVWDQSFSLRYIEVVSNEIICDGKIVLEFSSKEMWEKFNGLIITGF